MDPKVFPSLDLAAAEAIASLFSVPLELAPYRFRGEKVYRLVIPPLAERAPIEIVLWLPLSRVDVRAGPCALVFKSVSEVEIYPGVEVLFRRRDPQGHLFVSLKGQIQMAV